MLEKLTNLYGQLTSPPALAVVIYMLSLYCFLTALGITKGFQFGKLLLPAPRTRKGKILLSTLGVILFAFAVILSVSLLPEYRPTVSKKLIYAGDDAKQIVSDGEDVYLLKNNGHIFRITQNDLQLIDDGTGTRQIAPAGGVIYILKESGNIWAYQWVSEKPDFKMKDPGTGTKQIVSVGETLYVLKNNGNIWKYFTRHSEKRNIKDEFVLIDDGTETEEISSSGALLYVLKKNGNIWQYAPIHKESGPYEEIYKGGDAISIKADGGALYFIKGDGSTWKYKGRFTLIDTGKNSAKRIDALNGIVYILTTQNTIWRYNSQYNNSRELREADSDNEAIAAYGPDIFVIKSNGSIWRYNEGLLKR